MSLFDFYSSCDLLRKIAEDVSYADVIKNPMHYLKILLEKNGFNYALDGRLFSPSRALHIINMYLLQELTGDLFNAGMRGFCPNNKVFEYWTMLSLAHDLGYYYETHIGKEFKTVDTFCKFHNYINFFSQCSVPTYYNGETFLNYYKFKLDYFKQADHGILGAVEFFNSTKLNMDEKIALSYLIASHNIFVASKSMEEIYIEYDLSCLIPNCVDYIKLPQNKDNFGEFYTLLCLLDITEIVNLYDYDEPKKIGNILSNVSMFVKEKEIDIISTRQIISDLDNKLGNISTWLNVKKITTPQEIILKL